ncbi:Pattern recognition serine proteinase [Operophtera brumata]|uniref:Pattern recognition serine proteinase n=1 Tax=Operophtera brumata TaxID=104452 RepID=A0A0L7L1S2_OPEBR|nr:Pattern recognition serine proteinase [Operophtera brumata]
MHTRTRSGSVGRLPPASQFDNTALCRGDSGGGLVFSSSTMGIERYYLRGVVSTAPTSDDLCNTASYTTFTQLTKHEQFIKQYWIESGEFHCQDGSFIASGTQCDGARDCADGSDETEDACAAQTCAEGLFRCAYGACVDRGATPEAVSCILPPYPEHGAYTTDIAGAEPGQGYERVTVSNVTCERGYDALGYASREFSCSHGVWTGSVPKCVSICGSSLAHDNVSEAGSCILPPFPEHGAYTTDIAGAELGQGYERVTVSNVTCERGYDARGSASREFSCSHGVWTGSVPRCVCALRAHWRMRHGLQRNLRANPRSQLQQLQVAAELSRGRSPRGALSNVTSERGGTSATHYCDGARDCADGFDETEDACATQTCAEGLFRCAYGACVD